MRKYLIALLLSARVFGWGELGHQIIAKEAAKLVGPLAPYALQLGHLANIPDIYWRALGDERESDAKALGDPTHYLDLEDFKGKVPAAYDKAYKKAGSLPWRAQQLASLYAKEITDYPKADCKTFKDAIDHPTRRVIAFAGLLSHFTGDASMPYHSTTNYDGQFTGQKGIHSYFETDIVNALEPGLQEKVGKRAKELGGAVAALRAKGGETVSGLMLALLADSYSKIEEVAALDKKNPRDPAKAAKAFEPIVVERLALAVAVTADIWKRGLTRPLCPSWRYAVRPSFVSPTDANCFGYVSDGGPKWKSSASCVTF